MAITLNYVALIVHDMQRSLAFYRDLGMPVPEHAHLSETGEPQLHVEVRDGGLRVAWESEALARQLNPAWTPPTGNARLGVAFEVSAAEEVDAVCERMRARGHRVLTEPFDAFWGQRYATLHDPDGNAVDVFAFLPG